MNYLKEIVSFTDWLLWNPLTTSSIVLWYQLMAINNKCRWADEFTVANLQLQSMTGLSRQGVASARNVLIKEGRITYQKHAGNLAGKYKMIRFECNNLGTVIGTTVAANPAQKHTQNRHKASTLNKQETKTETKQIESLEGFESDFVEKWHAYEKWFGDQDFKYVIKLEEQITPLHLQKLLEKVTAGGIKEKILAIENGGKKYTSNKSVYLTVNNWINRDRT